MSNGVFSGFVRAAAAAAAMSVGASFGGGAALAAPPPYQLVGSFPGPGPIFDVAPDGRVYALAGRSILRQDSVGGSTYSAIRELPVGSVNAFGASFLRFSPDGSKLAIGDGNFGVTAAVLVVDAQPFNGPGPIGGAAAILGTVTTPNFDAAWDGNSRLYVTGARATDFVPLVNRVDLALPSATASTVVTGIGGASGGIAIRNGSLYTGSGYLPTGEVRSFSLGALTPGSPVAFSAGSLLGSFLSASPLGFDNLGNLHAGGGDTFSGTSDTGYAAVVDPADPTNFLRLAPAGPTSTYSPIFNAATGELLVFDSLNSTFHRYSVPAAPAGALLTIAGVLAARRRR